MVWFYMASYVFVVGCMIYWSWRAQKAEAKVATLTKMLTTVLEDVSRIFESDTANSNNEEEVND